MYGKHVWKSSQEHGRWVPRVLEVLVCQFKRTAKGLGLGGHQGKERKNFKRVIVHQEE